MHERGGGPCVVGAWVLVESAALGVVHTAGGRVWGHRPGLMAQPDASARLRPRLSQDYIDSMEGATLSGRQCACAIVDRVPALQGSAAAKQAAAAAV